MEICKTSLCFFVIFMLKLESMNDKLVMTVELGQYYNLKVKTWLDQSIDKRLFTISVYQVPVFFDKGGLEGVYLFKLKKCQFVLNRSR